MLKGDEITTRVPVADCLTVVELALTDCRSDYAPYSWQVVLSDSKKGRLLAIAKAHPQSQLHPSFSLNLCIRSNEENHSIVSWDFDATDQCADVAARASHNLKRSILSAENDPELTGRATRKDAPATHSQSKRLMLPTAGAPQSAVKEEPEAEIRGVIPALRVPAPVAKPDAQQKALTSQSINSTKGRDGTGRMEENKSTGKIAAQAVASPITTWLRHFILGDSCPGCGAGKEGGAGCEDQYHKN